MLNRCWVCVEFMWIICRISVDYMSNRCWIDVVYIQSRIEAKQWTLELYGIMFINVYHIWWHLPARVYETTDRWFIRRSFCLDAVEATNCKCEKIAGHPHGTWDLWAGSVSTSTLGLGTLAFTWLSSCDCVESHAMASQKPAETLIVGNCCMNPSVCVLQLTF